MQSRSEHDRREGVAWQRDGEHTFETFRFANGQSLDQLRMHYITVGEPQRDAAGRITNAVLLIHNTTGTAASWSTLGSAESCSGRAAARRGAPLSGDPGLYRARQVVQASDGMRAAFPNYRFVDQVEAQRRLLVEALGVLHLKLVLGPSMGGMLTWTVRADASTLHGRSGAGGEPAGADERRNWIQRRISIEAIRNDREWNGGNYAKNPSRYVFTAPSAR